MKLQKTSKQLTYPFLVSAIALALALPGCGGGGGDDGDDFVGAALVSIQASPKQIDTGDRMQISTEIESVHENGILLKFKIPASLEYVIGSSTLEIDSDPQDATPAVNEQKDNTRYLVFFLDQDLFGDDGRGTLTFQLKGSDKLTEGRIEVDADVNDPLVNDNNEFSVSNPEFGAEDDVTVDVTG